MSPWKRVNLYPGSDRVRYGTYSIHSKTEAILIPQRQRYTWLIPLAGLMAASPSLAFDTLDGDRSNWPNNPSYSVANAPPEVGLAAHRDAVRSAFGAWAAVADARIDFDEQNDNGDIPVQYLAAWPREFGASAAGITNTERRGSRITRARISLNGESFDWSTNGEAGTSDVQGVMTHEIGHAIGLGHSFYRESTMYWTGDSGDDLGMRSLAPDDVRGARFLYGNGGEGRLCDTCEDNDDCANGSLCLQLEADRSFCGEPCVNGRCPENAACFELRNGGTQCAPMAQVCSDSAEGEFGDGDYCFGSGQCGADRMCYPTADSARCATICTPGRDRCAEGQCVALGGDEIPGLCLLGGDAPYGAPCENHTDCETVLCLPLDEGNSVCSDRCDPMNNDCPAGLCVETMDPDLPAVCLPPGEGLFGSPCESSLECASQICVPLTDDDSICATACDPSRRECPDGRCFETEDPDTPGICLPLGDAPYGAICEGDLECGTGLCLPLSDTFAVCSQECSEADECPTGQCLETGFPDLPFVCVPPGDVEEGGRCGTPEARCIDDLSCIGDAGAEACRRTCAPFGACPAGLGCSPYGAEAWFCLPEDGPSIGEECEEICAGGLLCLFGGDEDPNLCVRPCFPGAGDCGDGHCFELIEGLGICPTGAAEFGDPCESHLDCLSTLCVPGGDGGVCSRPCADDAECGNGWRCEETQSRGSVCFPADESGGEMGAGGLEGIGNLPGFGGNSGGGGAMSPGGMAGNPDAPVPGTGGTSGGDLPMGGTNGAFMGGGTPTAVPTPYESGQGDTGCDVNPDRPFPPLPLWLAMLVIGCWRKRRMNVRLDPPSSAVED